MTHDPTPDSSVARASLRDPASLTQRLRRRAFALRWVGGALALVLTMVGRDAARAQSLRTDLPITNGQVSAQVVKGDTLFLGGSFSYVGPVTGAGVPIDTASASPTASFPAINGTVQVTIPDGTGGWFLGGQFTSVGSVARTNLAHILADGSVSAWAPTTNGLVRTLVLRSTTLYVGGDFTLLNGTARNRAGAVQASTGALLTWNPNANNAIRAFALAPAGLFVGGSFTTIGGQTRNRIALLDFTTGSAITSWNPGSNSIVQALLYEPSIPTLYVGGQFTNIGGLARNRLAALDPVTGATSGWNPNLGNSVNAIAVGPTGLVYAGGLFTSVGAQARNRIAEIDPVTGLATAWNPNAGNAVNTLVAVDGVVYAGGDFLTIGGQARSRIARLSVATGAATAWNPSAFGSVLTLALDANGALFVGGSFNGIGGTARNNLAAFSMTTGQLLPWDPNADNQVQALALSGESVVVGGNFTQVGGQIRNNLAVLDATNGIATAFDANVDGQVSAVSVLGSRIYLGGLFANVGGQPRVNLAAVDRTTGTLDAWTADANDQVFAVHATPEAVYVGGNFTTLAGLTRSFVGALDPTTAAVQLWAPEANGTVRALASTCDRVFAAGFFTSIGSQARNRVASLNRFNGGAGAWDPNANGPVYSLQTGAGVLYLGGVFSQVGGVTRNRVAAVDPVTGTLSTTWNPNSSGTVRSVVAVPGGLALGGLFSTMTGAPSGNLAVVTGDAGAVCATVSLPTSALPLLIVGTATSQAFSATGGTGSYCYRLSSGALPTGLSLDFSTGTVSGTPSVAGNASFAITATDARGCAGTQSYEWGVAATPAVNAVAIADSGLCLNTERTLVSVPFVLSRGDSLALRTVRVTFEMDTTRLQFASPGGAAANVHAAVWGSSFANRILSVIDLGLGRTQVVVSLTGTPCGVTTGGTLFTVDLAAQGPTGDAAVSLVSVSANDCAGTPVALNLGAAGHVSVPGTTIALSPSALPSGVSGTAYSQTITASGGTAPYGFEVISGALPAGLTLSASGVLSGVPAAHGTFAFTIRATEPAGCSGHRDYTLVLDCPTIALTPAYLPDGAVGDPYTASVLATGGLAPYTYGVTAGALPVGVTLAANGAFSGTPSAAGPANFTVTATDAAGCAVSESFLVDVFASPPVSTVQAEVTTLALSSANACVAVPFVYTRGESDSARALSVSFQLEPARLALCGPLATAVHLGPWMGTRPNSHMEVVDDGLGSYTVDLVLLGEPCGITTGDTLFTVDVQGSGADGTGAITVTHVESRMCDNTPIPVKAGPVAALRIQHTDLVITPSSLPNPVVGQPYAQALSVSNGVAPFSFSLASGALPSGLTLAPNGVISGTPTATGPAAFTVHATDVAGVPGSRAYTVTVGCPVLALAPATLADGQVGSTYSETLVPSGGTAPYTITLVEGVLPAGLTLDAAGVIAGTPTSPGTRVLSFDVTDAYGCRARETYTLSVFNDPAVSHIAASTAGLCLSSERAQVRVPFRYTRGDATPARLAHVEFSIDSRFQLAAPGAATNSILVGSWLSAYPQRAFQVLDLGGGTYSVDVAVLGQPCGPDSGGVLFTVDLASSGGDGVGDLTVLEAVVRDCDNQPLPVQPGPPAQLIVNHVAPSALTDLAAAQITGGNDASGRTGIVLTWTAPSAGRVELYRAPFGSYPGYDNGGGAAPDSSEAPDGPWTLVSADAASGIVDVPPTRGFWHHVAIVVDSCDNRSAVSNMTRGALDYHLGDVTDGAVRGQGDNRVQIEDVTLLGAHYGISGAAITTAGVGYLDVGPTTDGASTSRPTTDGALGFDDLVLFSLNFETVSAPALRARPAAPPSAAAAEPESFELEAPMVVSAGDEFVATLRVRAAGAMQGFSAGLAWNDAVLEPLGTESAGFAEAQGGVAFVPRAGVIDAVRLGRHGAGFTGQGEVARFRFRARREGDPGLHLSSVDARDAANRKLALGAIAQALVPAVPAHDVLLAPAPNPARGQANLSFGVARRGAVDLAIYSIDGRRVRVLAHGLHEAGSFRIAWRGDDDAGREQSPGIYWARLTVGEHTFTRRIVYLR